MFEKFARQTRQVVLCALGEARDRSASVIGCEHLLIAITHAASGPAVEALAARGLGIDRLRELAGQPAATAPLDADALAVIGIDLDAVKSAAEAAFGLGALDRASREPARRPRLSSDAKASIGLALRVAQRSRARAITPAHLLLGLLDQGDNAAVRLLERAGVPVATVRADTVRRINTAA
ncbi:MAG TPA: Clp protease N-terminal domain-containing protein [Streptosporangiaceae bacterium]|nr:Clp protease N-terminal domain-containing protein [Streptosporangiaceae bacterium]